MESLVAMERETIAEVGNISLGAAATALSALLNRRVEITTPRVEVLTVSQVKEGYPLPCLMVGVNYLSGLQGENILLLKEEDARVIATLMMGAPAGLTPEGELGALAQSAVQEAFNQMMGFMSTSMSEMFGTTIEISPPAIKRCNLADIDVRLNALDEEDRVVQIAFTIRVENELDSTLIQVVPLRFAREMTRFLLDRLDFAAAEEPPRGAEDRRGGCPVPENPVLPEHLLYGTAVNEKKARRPGLDGYGPSSPPPETVLEKLDLVKDIPVIVTVVLGKTNLPLGKLFTLGRGGVIDLHCAAGEPVEILVNNRLVARGEVVAVNDELAVRIVAMQAEPGDRVLT